MLVRKKIHFCVHVPTYLDAPLLEIHCTPLLRNFGCAQFANVTWYSQLKAHLIMSHSD